MAGNERDIIEWGNTFLVSHGYQLISSAPDVVQHTPWSYVLRFVTHKGYVYLKQTPELLALEASIMQLLSSQFQASVPKVIAHNKQLNCFLMNDAGNSLRGILKQKFDESLLCNAVEQFTSLQRATEDRVEIFLDLGVPDYRLDKLTALYEESVKQNDLLLLEGLTEGDIDTLYELSPMLYKRCEQLADYSIKPTIVQPDFHDNNLLVNRELKKITFIDLGEIVIAHPFFSLLICLAQIKKHHGLTDEHSAYLRVRDAGLQHFMDVGSKEYLLDAFEQAHTVWLAYEILANFRLLNACGRDNLLAFQHGKLGALCKNLITALYKK